MEQLRAVKIIHDRRNRGLYNVVAEFFRFIGVFVQEEVRGEAPEEKSGDDIVGVAIVLSNWEGKTTVFMDEPDVINVRANVEFRIELNEEFLREKRTDLMGFLSDILKNIWKVESLDTESLGVSSGCLELAEKLLEVFLEENVVLAAMNLQYYRIVSELHNTSRRIFQSTVKALEELVLSEKQKNMMMYGYALLYCKQKVNLACWLQKEEGYDYRRANGELCNKDGIPRKVSLEYPVSELVKECEKLLKRYPEEANLHVLLGLITERAQGGYQIAVQAYTKALDLLQDQTYASHIYYWLGWLHEKYGNNMTEAKRAYVKAYLLQKKYRNIYKVAVMYEKERDYEKFRDYLLECKQSLEWEGDILPDPLEIEYYCKVCLLLCVRSYQYFDNMEDATQYREEGEAYLERHVGDRGENTLKKIYGADFRLYESESLSRVDFGKADLLLPKIVQAEREAGVSAWRTVRR